MAERQKNPDVCWPPWLILKLLVLLTFFPDLAVSQDEDTGASDVSFCKTTVNADRR